MKKIYIAAWVLLVTSAFLLASVGSFSPLSLVVLSLAALSLVYTLALWSVFDNSRNASTAKN